MTVYELHLSPEFIIRRDLEQLFCQVKVGGLGRCGHPVLPHMGTLDEGHTFCSGSPLKLLVGPDKRLRLEDLSIRSLLLSSQHRVDEILSTWGTGAYPRARSNGQLSCYV